MPAQTIDEVIQRLDEIIEWAIHEESRLGYFPALYRKVTKEIQRGIQDGEFEDAERMERLDTIFANRYLDAFDRYRDGQEVTRSYRVAFEGATRWTPLVLQHLLLWMNAHINLDLGVAAAQTSPGEAIADLQNDFNSINDVLASLLDGVQNELASLWWPLGLIDKVLGRLDENLANFAIGKARDSAWENATRLAGLNPEDQARQISEIDQKVALLGEVILHHGIFFRPVVLAIRLGERGTIPQIIKLLM